MHLEGIALILSATVFPIAVILLVVIMFRERREHRAALAEQASKPDAQIEAHLRALIQRHDAALTQGGQVLLLLQRILTNCGAGAIAAEIAKGLGEAGKGQAIVVGAAERVVNGPPSVRPAALAAGMQSQTEQAPTDPASSADDDPDATTVYEAPSLPLQSRPAPGPRRSPTMVGLGAVNGTHGSNQASPLETTIRTSRIPAPGRPV